MLALRTTLIFAAGLFTLALFQSSAAVTAAYDWENEWAQETIVPAIETWHGWMEQLGTAGLTESISDQLEEWHEITVDPDA